MFEQSLDLVQVFSLPPIPTSLVLLFSRIKSRMCRDKVARRQQASGHVDFEKDTERILVEHWIAPNGALFERVWHAMRWRRIWKPFEVSLYYKAKQMAKLLKKKNSKQ